MSFVNIRKLKEIAQKKINGLTNQSDISEFEDLVRFVQLSGGGHLSVDSDGTLPDTGMIAFDKQYDRFFYNKKAPKFRDDASRPGGTVSDNAVTRTFDRRRRRRTNWSRKIYGRIAQGFPQPVPTTDVIQGNIGYYGGHGGISRSITFASNTVATVPGIGTTRTSGTGGASKTHGYWMGGGGGPYTASVQKFPFAATDALSDVGDLINQANGNGSHSHNEAVGNRAFVYAAGGISSRTNVIQKMPTSSDTDFTDVGDLTYTVNYNSGASSSTHGYSMSGTAPGYVTTINKYSFTTDGNATLVGNLALAQFDGSGQSSEDNGYHTSGYFTPPVARRKDVQKFPFASDGNATDIGDLTYGGHYTTGTQSSTNGYQIGGNAMIPYLQYFPFASDTMYNPSVAATLSPTTQKDQSTQDVAS